MEYAGDSCGLAGFDTERHHVLDVGSFNITVGDVEDERRSAAVVVGAVRKVEVARTEEVARTGLDVRPTEFPRHGRILRRLRSRWSDSHKHRRVRMFAIVNVLG